MFFSIYHPKGCGGRDVSSSFYCYISYIESYPHVSLPHFPSNFTLQANNIEEFPILEICTQESRSFVQRMVATFLFKAGWRLLSYFFQRCPKFCVKNVASQAIVAMVIFANAIWLAIQTDWRLRLGQEGAVVLACLVLLKWTCDKYSHSRSS